MIYKVVSIRDRASDLYSAPIFVASLGAAIRSFGDEVNRKAENNQLNSHPEDFDLYLIGEWNDESAAFGGGNIVKQIAIGKDYKAKE